MYLVLEFTVNNDALLLWLGEEHPYYESYS